MIISTHGILSSITTALPFEFTVKTDNAGVSTSTQFRMPLTTSTGLNMNVDWGDGSPIENITVHTNAIHTYSTAGTYTISVTGSILGWQFNNGGDSLKILNINSWGVLNISVGSGFRGCTNLTCTATDAPLITTTDLSNYFRSCINFNGEIGNWNVSNVNSMAAMFLLCDNFNQNIGSWDVSNVSDFGFLFYLALLFNNGGSSDINNWTIKTTGTVDMTFMFRESSFNQPIGNWNVSAVTNMSNMFQSCPFNQDIGSWNVSNVTNFSNFMIGKTSANYSASNLDSIYNGWSLRSVKPNLSISFGTIKYTSASSAGKAILTGSPNNWTITDGGI